MFLFGIKSMSSRAHTHKHTQKDTATQTQRVATHFAACLRLCVCVRSCGAAGKQEQEQDADGAETARQQWREEGRLKGANSTRMCERGLSTGGRRAQLPLQKGRHLGNTLSPAP